MQFVTIFFFFNRIETSDISFLIRNRFNERDSRLIWTFFELMKQFYVDLRALKQCFGQFFEFDKQTSLLLGVCVKFLASCLTIESGERVFMR